jgi:hypothetical protein
MLASQMGVNAYANSRLYSSHMPIHMPIIVPPICHF